MAPRQKFKRHEIGSGMGGCGNSCTNSCCLDPPPDTIDLYLVEPNGANTCVCKLSQVTYNPAVENPAGKLGIWSADVEVSCWTGTPQSCKNKTIKVELWCDNPCDNNCKCNCANWGVRINEGATFKMGDNQDNTCCCGAIGGKHYLYWDAVTAGTLLGYGCEDSTFALRFYWNGSQTCLEETVITGCCIAPLPKTITAKVSHACSATTWDVELTAEDMDCGECDQANPQPAIWTHADALTVQCWDAYENCHDVDVFVSLICTQCDVTQTKDACDGGEWLVSMTSDCWELNETLPDSNCGCRDCGGGQMSLGLTYTLTASPTENCECDGFQSFSIGFFDEDCAQDRACPTMPGDLSVLLYSVGEQADCQCGVGVLSYEPVNNDCGCVGQWRGFVTLECKDGDGNCTQDTVEVTLCTDCDECLLQDCVCTQWKLTVDNGTATPTTKDEDCCCGREVLYFGEVTGTGGGVCGNKPLNAKVWWQQAFQSVIATSESGGGCKMSIPKTLDMDVTDTCGVTRDLTVTGGLENCTDPLYFAEWHLTGGMDCLDGITCQTLINDPATIRIRQRRSDFGWEAAIEWCFDGSPRVVNATTVTCPTCDGATKFSLAATFPGPWTGCDGDCDNNNNIVIAVTEI